MEKYLLKKFDSIDYTQNTLRKGKKYENGYYILPNSGIGYFVARYDIENVKEEKDTITFNCNTVFYGDGVDVLLKTQKFTLIKKNDNYVIKSIKITFKKKIKLIINPKDEIKCSSFGDFLSIIKNCNQIVTICNPFVTFLCYNIIIKYSI